MPRRLVIALLCGALALLAGCGRDSAAPKRSDAPAAAPSGDAAPAQVAMKDNRYVPDKIEVKVGEKIVWRNDDSYPHTVTATKGAGFNSVVDGGRTYAYTPRRVGRIDYVCTIHSGQSGTITVTR